MRTNLLKTMVVGVGLLASSSVAFAEETTTTYTFEDENAVFTADSRITVAIENDATLNSNVVSFTNAKNCQNGYGFAHYDFTSLTEKAQKVTLNFDYYNLSGARGILSIGDASVRGTTGGCSKVTYGSTGAIFRIGSDKSYGIVNSSSKLSQSDYCNKWLNVNVVVDVVNKKMSYVVKDGDTEVTSATDVDYYASDANACTQIDVFGYINSKKGVMLDNLSITSYVDESVTTADYTVNKVCDGTVLETKTYNGVIGADPTITTDDITVDGTKYIYVSNDAETVGAIAEGNVYTVTYRKASTFGYTVKFLNGEEELATAVTGSVSEGESAYVPYRKYINIDGTLYNASAQGNEYRLKVTPTADAEVYSVAYSATEITNVVYFAEAEEIEGLTATSKTPADVRCSNGLGGYAASEDAITLTNLAAGTYKIVADVFGGGTSNNATASFNYGGESTFDVATVGYMLESASDEFTLTAATDITLTLTGSGSTKGLDFVYIQKTADSTTGINAVSVEDAAKAVYYNVSGQRVAKPSKGLYIVNGKKVVVK